MFSRTPVRVYTWTNRLMGPDGLPTGSARKAKSHVIAVQLIATEWLMLTSSCSPLPPLPPHHFSTHLLHFFFSHVLFDDPFPTSACSLAAVRTSRPFTAPTRSCADVFPVTSSSTSQRWKAQGRSCWISCVCHFVGLSACSDSLPPLESCWCCRFPCVICRR